MEGENYGTSEIESTVNQDKEIPLEEREPCKLEDENCGTSEIESTVNQDKEVPPTEREPCKFYLEGKCWFKDNCLNLHVGGVKNDSIIKGKASIVNPVSQQEDVQETSKKPSLRTAGDVRKRIQWDPMLKSSDFSIGYLDRFDGVIEKPFSAFTWEHLADAEIDDLAIPQHRIHYFKYKGKTVWDKNIRLDHVFGSAGNDKTIYDIVEEIDRNAEDISDCSEESDSDIEIDVNVSQEKSALSDAQEKVENNKSLRATHFLCIKIDNKDLEKQVKEVQDYVISGDVMLRSCAMPTEILHVTLAMVKCEDDSAVDSVSEILNELKDTIPELESYNSSNILNAKNLSTFGSRVLYSKLKVPPIFNEVISILQQRLRRLKGVTITNQFDFVPHMTLIKVNRYIAKERRSKYIDSILYHKYYEVDFGDIIFNNIHFCIINDYRGTDGFYLTTKKIEF